MDVPSAARNSNAPAGRAATLHLHGDLVDLAGLAVVGAPVRGRRGVKDAIEATGVPHTEVGLVTIDGRSVGWPHLLRGGEEVHAWPLGTTDGVVESRVRPPPLPRPPSFVADVHLGTLARRLRLLGFDTWWTNDADDALLAELAVDEERVLLTRDRQLLMRRAITHGALVRHDDPTRQIDEIVARFDLAGQFAPRTRCIACNGLLESVSGDEVAHRLEPGTIAADHDDFGRCRSCDGVYWPGAHDDALTTLVRRIRTIAANQDQPRRDP